VIRRLFRIGLLLGLLAGVAFALTKLLGSRNDRPKGDGMSSPEPWPRLDDLTAVAEPLAAPKAPAKAPAAKKPAAKKTAARKAPPAEKPGPTSTSWVAPTGGVCPTSHPVKAKLASKIFHLPGMQSYDRTKPDRCYAAAEQAEADGLRAAKR